MVVSLDSDELYGEVFRAAPRHKCLRGIRAWRTSSPFTAPDRRIPCTPIPCVYRKLGVAGIDLHLEPNRAARKSEEWVEQCLRDLEMLAELPHVMVVVSSRPILLMDAGRPGFAFGRSSGMELLPFSEEQIRRWCTNYVNGTGSAQGLSWEYLDERGLADVARKPLVLYMVASLLTEKRPQLSESRHFSRAQIYRLFVERTARGSYVEDGVKYRLPDDYPAIFATWRG